ncbi:MAG: hypothetical protein A2984_02700 [Omnitrophica WOR_2 bacterium RIFCSPLOWO2_01_FULL_41_12]|nr:MAG: hypothetical protein A2984_02700 [Omnitrophica WOR_2 bacterium RIFCSPLOWO2_01_FULL_41_12]
MKIINQTKNTILAENVIVADRPFQRIKGLLGKKEFKPGQALVLKPCNSIHTFFMKFPIDVLFVDKDNRVIKAVPTLKPFCLTYIYFRAILAIELPVGTIPSTLTQEGDTLTLI